MPLPTNRELREMLEYASPYPWQKEWGYIIASEREPGRVLADLWDTCGGEYPRKEDAGLMLIAPQLAEEVIRLREEIDRLKWYCLDGCRVAEAEEAYTTGEHRAREQGKQAAYYGTYLQIAQGQHKGNK